MITIKHVLKDGTKVSDVAGHVVKAAEHEALYQVMERIINKENLQCVRKS